MPRLPWLAVTDRRPRTLDELPTPALLFDLDALEANLATMQERADGLGVRLRPHLKTHKCVEVGRMQREAGARGVTVATLEEARVFADHGFDDLLWAFPVILSRLDEVVELAQRVELGVAVDSAEAVRALEGTGRPLSVWLEIDCGYGRSGVPYGDDEVLELARRIEETDRLRLAGCFTHAGHAYHAETPARIREIAEEERTAMVSAGDRLRAGGVEPGTLSVGSTPGMSLAARLDGVDEARPGNYALYDYTQLRLGSCTLERCAATVLTSVVSSRPAAGRSIADCGALVLSKDLGPDDPPHFGRLFASLDGGALDPEARVVSVSQEHGTISATMPVGTKLRVLPNHSCLTVASFDHAWAIRGHEVLDRWKIWRARGS